MTISSRSILKLSSILFLLFLIVPFTFGAGHDNNVEWDGLAHNSHDPLYRSPAGAIPTGTSVRIRLRAANNDLTGANLRVWDDRHDSEMMLPMTKVASNVILPNHGATPYEFWEATIPASAQSTVYWYRFIVYDGWDTNYYEDDAGRTGGYGQVYDTSPDHSYQLTVYDPSFQTPDWVKNAVIYQIFPDRFRDGDSSNNPSAGEFFYGNNDTIFRSNQAEWNTAICDPRSRPGAHASCADAYSQNFYGGDLQGIIDELDYLESLGVTALYLNPIFESPSNHKYDTTDFFHIDDNFGDLATFQALVAQANARGMKIILDGVFNHSSSDSVYFDRYNRWTSENSAQLSSPSNAPILGSDMNGACESKTGLYDGWYPFFDYEGGGASPCSDNRDYPKWFQIYDSLPVFQHDHPEVRDYFINNGINSVGPYWMQWADGWRLDVAGEIDHGTIVDPSDDYWEAFRAAVRAVNPEAYIVGEEWGNSTSWTIDNQWDASMNYQFGAAISSFWRDELYIDNDFNYGSSSGILDYISPSDFANRMTYLQERSAPEAYLAMMNLFNSHDTNRLLFMLDPNVNSASTGTYANPNYDWSRAIQRQRGAVLMLLTLPGAPTIYYGDEVGLVNPPSHDGGQWQDDPYNRAPYPWLDEAGTPYYTHLQTDGAGSTRDQIFTHYQTLIDVRNHNPALRTGTLDFLLTDDGNGVVAYGRKLTNDTNAAIVVANGSNSARNVTVDVSGYIPAGSVLNDVLNGGTITVSATGTISVSLDAESGNVYTMGGFGGRPVAVTDLAATVNSGNVNLTWSAVANADNYDIYRSQISGGGYHYIGNAATNSYTDTSADTATQYFYVIVSKNSGTLLASGFSNEVSATPAWVIDWANLQSPPTLNHVLSAITSTGNIFGQVWIDGVTDRTAGQVAGVLAEVGYGGVGVHPSDPSWTWFPMTFNVESGNNDEYMGTLLPSAVGTFKYTTRWSTDGGVTWIYADTIGIPYDEANAGTLTVTAPTDSTPPTAPTGLTVSNTTTFNISLTWATHPDDDGDLYGFRVVRDGVVIATIADPSATSYIDNSVTPLTTYTYTIVALDESFNASGASNPVTATAEMKMIDVTFNVTVPADTLGTVYIVGNFDNFAGSPYPAWDTSGIALNVVDATTRTVTLQILDGTSLEYKYTRGDWERVEKGADGNFELSNRPLTVSDQGGNTQTVNDTVLNWRDPYVLAVVPADSATVANTTSVAITWNQAMPAEPTGFTLTGPSGVVTGTWSYDAGTFAHTFTPSSPLVAGSHTISISGAIDIAGDSQQVPFTSTFTAEDTTPPAAPTGLTVTTTTHNSVSLAWDVHPNTAGDLAGFRIVREDVTNATPAAVIATVNDPLAVSYIDNTVDPETEYNYTIVAFDTSANDSPASNVANTTTLTPPVGFVDVTFTVTVPAFTGADPVYIAGNFDNFTGSTYPNWEPDGIILTQVDATTWEVMLTLPDGANFEYKYARGDWDAGEMQANGYDDLPANRTLTVTDDGAGEQAIADTVANWRDPIVVSVVPVDGAVGVVDTATIEATFNKNMPALPHDTDGLNDNAFTVTGPSGVVTGTISYGLTENILVFTPDVPLEDGVYTLAIDAVDWSSPALAQIIPFSSTFTVGIAVPTPTLTPTPALTLTPTPAFTGTPDPIGTAVPTGTAIPDGGTGGTGDTGGAGTPQQLLAVNTGREVVFTGDRVLMIITATNPNDTGMDDVSVDTALPPDVNLMGMEATHGTPSTASTQTLIAVKEPVRGAKLLARAYLVQNANALQTVNWYIGHLGAGETATLQLTLFVPKTFSASSFVVRSTLSSRGVELATSEQVILVSQLEALPATGETPIWRTPLLVGMFGALLTLIMMFLVRLNRRMV